MKRLAALTAAGGVATVVALTLADGVLEVIAYELIVFWLVATAFVAIAPLRPAHSLAESARTGSLSTSRHPPQLQRLEWMVEFGTTSPADSEARLIPELRDLAAMRLQDRQGIDLHADRERSAAAVGEAAWPYLDPQRPRRFDGDALTTAELGVIVTTIERL